MRACAVVIERHAPSHVVGRPVDASPLLLDDELDELLELLLDEDEVSSPLDEPTEPLDELLELLPGSAGSSSPPQP